MLKHEGTLGRSLRSVTKSFDLVVVGGGLAGVCCAITAARAGIRVALVQDRPVLGGNSSSEVRLWVLGATSHMGNNNRWAREGGVIDEILVENIFRNPEGNPVLVDVLLLEKVTAENNITLLLNTAVHDVELLVDGSIQSVRAFCSQNSTQYVLSAPLFCDASGDGVVGFLSGAAFRMGAESRAEFGEQMAPLESSSDLLGHSLYFYSKDVGRPIQFTKPAFAIDDITSIPRYRCFTAREQGCQLWWIEYGGRRDTVYDTEEIKWELWKIVYGVWDHIKNSGLFPEAENLTLEWVGTIPGKRESRRFEGDYILTQQDIVEQRRHYDAVSYGGWAIDLHPVDGVYSPQSPCTQYHSQGVYQIPFRTMYSSNVANLLLAGRIVSASHIAFGSTRVMATCAHGGQAVGMAAALCRKYDWLPRQLAEPQNVAVLQQKLLRVGQYISGVHRQEADDLAQRAVVTSSSEQVIEELSSGNDMVALSEAMGLLLPVGIGRMPRLTLEVLAKPGTQILAELRTASRKGNFTPDMLLESLIGDSDLISIETLVAEHLRVDEPALGLNKGHFLQTPSVKDASYIGSKFAKANAVAAGQSNDIAVADSAVAVANGFSNGASTASHRVRQHLSLDFRYVFHEPTYVLVALPANPDVQVHLSEERLPGILTLRQRGHASVSKGSSQEPPTGVGIDAFDFWTPERRPKGKNIAVKFDPPLHCYSADQVANGVGRPTSQVNAWVANRHDPHPSLTLSWAEPQEIEIVEVVFDNDFDHPMETVLMQHPERRMPHCAQNLRLRLPNGRLLASVTDNHQTRVSIKFNRPIQTNSLVLEVDHPSQMASACVFEVKCYGPGGN